MSNMRKSGAEPSETDPLLSGNEGTVIVEKPRLNLKKEVSLFHAVGVILGLVIGNGIFISPKGVLQNVGSVGTSLIIWAASGLLNSVYAICFAELATIMPKAGGDYLYVHSIFGPFLGFLVMWLSILVIGPCTNGLLARTLGVYLFEAMGLSCYYGLLTLTAILIVLSFIAVNVASVSLAVKTNSVLSMTKIAALIFIIVVGIVNLAQGKTSNFENVFEGSVTDPGRISIGVFLGFYAFLGWQYVCTLTEEMKNPGRDLPIAIVLAMMVVTGIYVMTNIAFFTALSTEQFLSSDAVALTFMLKCLGVAAAWVMTICVCLSCAGSVSANLLTMSRYFIAAGRMDQMPYFLSMISLGSASPLPAVALQGLLSLIYCLFSDLTSLMDFITIVEEIKVFIALLVLLYVKIKRPDLKGSFQVPVVVVVFLELFLLVLMSLAVYSDPVSNGIGIALFLTGIPAYFIAEFCKKGDVTQSCMNAFTRCLQMLLLIVPETSHTDEKNEQ